MADKARSEKNDVNVSIHGSVNQSSVKDAQKSDQLNYPKIIVLLVTVIVACGSLLTSVGVVWSNQEVNSLKLTPVPMSLTFLLGLLLMLLLIFEKKSGYERMECSVKNRPIKGERFVCVEKKDNELFGCDKMENKGGYVVDRWEILSRMERQNDDVRDHFYRVRNENGSMKLYTLIAMVSFAFAGLVPLVIVVVSTLVRQGENLNGVATMPQIISTKWNFIALAFVAEFLAGLCMKMYFKLLDDSKHYVNEYMVFSKNIVSLSTLILLERDEGVQEVALKMLEYKSNRILKKGETTEEIMREHSCDSDNMKDLLKIAEMLAKAKST